MAPDSPHSDNTESPDRPARPTGRRSARRLTQPAWPFRSRPERRLWLSALAVVGAIYASLGRAPALSESLAATGLLSVAFLGGFVAAIVAVAMLGLSRRPSVREVAVGLAVAAVYTVALVRLQIPAERTHLFEYGVVASLIYLALLERRGHGGGVRAPAVWALLATAAFGWVDEAIQAVLPSRVYDLRDVGINALAALLAVTAIASMRWARWPSRSSTTPLDLSDADTSRPGD